MLVSLCAVRIVFETCDSWILRSFVRPTVTYIRTFHGIDSKSDHEPETPVTTLQMLAEKLLQNFLNLVRRKLLQIRQTRS